MTGLARKISVAALFMLGMQGSATLRAATSGEDSLAAAHVTMASPGTQIDGDLKEWRNCDWYGLSDPDSDLFARIAWQWDADSLYFAAVVRDHEPYTAPVDNPSRLYAYDSIQIALDPLMNAIPGQGRQSDDLEFAIGIVGKDPMAWVYFANQHIGLSGEGKSDRIKVAIRSREKIPGYIYEAAIPWSSLGVKPAANMKLGADLVINDGGVFEGIPHRRYITWGDGIANKKEPAAYRRLILADKGSGWSTSRDQKNLSYDKLEYRYKNAEKSTADPAATDGKSVTRQDADGICSWWFSAGKELPRGTYDAYARVKGIGTFDLQVAQDKQQQTSWLNQIESSSRYSTVYLGRIVQEGDPSLRISDWVAKGLSVDWLGLVPVGVREDLSDSRPELQRLRSALPPVAAKLNELRAKGMTDSQLAYPRAAFHIINLFADLLQTDVELSKHHRVHRQCKALMDRLNQVRSVLDELSEKGASTRALAVPAYPADGTLTLGPDGFYLNGKPFIALGLSVANASELLPMGLLMQHSFEPMDRMTRAPYNFEFSNSYRQRLDEVFAPANQAGIITDFLPAVHYVPAWIRKSHPEALARHEGFRGGFPYSPTYPKLRELLAPYYQTLLPYLASQKTVRLICLENEVSLLDFSDSAQNAFRAWLSLHYGTADAIARGWGTPVGNMDEIIVSPEDQTTSPAKWYDFNVFSESALVDLFTWMHQTVHQYAPQTWTHIKLMARAFESSRSEAGIDREALNNMLDVIGLDGPITGNMEAEYDLIRSLTPGKAIYNSEYHIVGLQSTEQDIHGAVWNHSMHGQGMAALWHGQLTAKERLSTSKQGGAQEADRAILYNPSALIGFSRASLDLQRLAPEVFSFLEQKPTLAIYFSHPSKILGGADYLNQALAIHTACRFAGIPVRFISDRQIAAGQLRGFQALVLPTADYASDATFAGISAYAQSGGKVIRIGQCLTRDEHAKPRRQNQIAGAELWQSASAYEYHSGLLDQRNLVPSGGPARSDGRPLWGVEWRLLQNEKETLLYMQNMLAEPVSITLPSAGKDLISGQSTSDRLVLEPHVPWLIQISRK